ncbi:MAG: sigma-54-dependent Fis family transcriptional regulator, partial [Planctomycetaceae bacterium]|nr:sigma-54-dependent Fis family transcriptional regulator [Planctomycetaceae bacterium]
HQCSDRAEGPFIAINCAAIPENMLEAMLFGYEKGAYTGAHSSSAGKFEQAQGGTLLLDEISEMNILLQAKLLRVLQEKQVERLGGKNTIDLNVRILATTNRDLKKEVEAGRFREDLYYRLNVFPIALPPLRERLEDIMPIAQALLVKHSKSGSRLEFSDEATEMLISHSWPGNIRELENVVQRAIVLSMGQSIQASDICLEIEDSLGDFSASEQLVSRPMQQADLKTTEKEMILHALKAGKGSRKYAAEKLGISPRTLRYKLARLKEQGVDVPPVMSMA